MLRLYSVMSHRSPYRPGVPSAKDMAVELGVHAARIVGDKSKLGVNGPGGGQGDPVQGVSHQEGLHKRHQSESVTQQQQQ